MVGASQRSTQPGRWRRAGPSRAARQRAPSPTPIAGPRRIKKTTPCWWDRRRRRPFRRNCRSRSGARSTRSPQPRLSDLLPARRRPRAPSARWPSATCPLWDATAPTSTSSTTTTAEAPCMEFRPVPRRRRSSIRRCSTHRCGSRAAAAPRSPGNRGQMYVANDFGSATGAVGFQGPISTPFTIPPNVAVQQAPARKPRLASGRRERNRVCGCRRSRRSERRLQHIHSGPCAHGFRHEHEQRRGKPNWGRHPRCARDPRVHAGFERGRHAADLRVRQQRGYPDVYIERQQWRGPFRRQRRTHLHQRRARNI